MHLVLSVGTNPLPVALAGLCYRDVSEVHLVCSPQAKDACARIVELWNQHGFTPTVQAPIIISSEPNGASDRTLRELPKKDVHFHYSGGTKAMALAISKALPRVESSYISLYSNRMFGDAYEFPSGDLRLNPRTQLTLNQLTRLHGFFPCTHCDGRPIIPLTGRLTGLAEKADAWENREIANKLKYTRIRDSGQPPITFLTTNSEIAASFNEAFGSGTFKPAGDGEWSACFSPATADFWDFDAFFRPGGSFEFKVRLALEKVLADSIWNPAAVFHGVYFGRDERVLREKDLFEADLLTVLGYQLLYVSCTTKGERAKVKAFEAYHRARQLGGAGARALVIAGLYDKDRENKDESLLHLEIGLPDDDRSLRIIRVDTARTTVDALIDKIRNYLTSISPGAN